MSSFKSRLSIAATVLPFIFAALFALFRISKSTTFQFMGEIHARVETGEKILALTFDDGPNPLNTPQILALLEYYRAKATFFMIGGNIRKHPDLARAVLDRGHQIANHSFTHQRMVMKSPAFVRAEITDTEREIRAIGFEGEILFRAPYGKKLFVLPYLLSSMNLKNIMWDVESRDTETQDAEALSKRVLDGAGAGSIVLFHDGGEHKPGTIAAVKKLLKEKTAEGFQFVTVSELLQSVSSVQ